MATKSDVLASIEANLQQAMERKKPREQVIIFSKNKINVFFSSRQLNLNLMVKFELVVY